jgi:hypothetical protein
MALSRPTGEQNKLEFEERLLKVAIVGSQTQASIKTYCVNDNDLVVYHEDDTRTVTEHDSDIGFALTDLDNDAAPAVLGFLYKCGDAEELVEVSVPTVSIVNTNLTGAMTAGVVTKQAGGDDGITSNGNIAFSISCTALDIDEDNATTPNCTFYIRLVYRRTQP